MTPKRTLIITGALGGIGLAAIRLFSKQDLNIVGIDIKPKTEPMVNELLTLYPSQFSYEEADCTDENQVESVIRKIASEKGSIDILFNIVGGSGRRFGDGPIHECTLEGYRKTLDLNLTSQFLVNKYTVMEMLKAGNGGCIINTASVLGMVGGNEMFSTHTYAASKAAIIGLSRSMAVYYAKQHIRVNVIAPGLLETPMSTRALNDEKILDYMDYKQPIYASKHRLGNPLAVAKAAEFLASEEADFITGTVIPVDGGWTAQ